MIANNISKNEYDELRQEIFLLLDESENQHWKEFSSLCEKNLEK